MLGFFVFPRETYIYIYALVESLRTFFGRKAKINPFTAITLEQDKARICLQSLCIVVVRR